MDLRLRRRPPAPRPHAGRCAHSLPVADRDCFPVQCRLLPPSRSFTAASVPCRHHAASLPVADRDCFPVQCRLLPPSRSFTAASVPPLAAIAQLHCCFSAASCRHLAASLLLQ